jgi:glycosyltransferase involved in cell wall biosynthesis
MSGVPSVSVVISTFNRASSLSRTLWSLAQQSADAALDFEVIVVDNKCTDGTAAVVQRFLVWQPERFRYVFEPRQGVSYGRNAGIRAARAPIVAFTDDDNEATPQWVTAIKDALDQHPEAAAVGGRILPEWPAPVPEWLDERHWSPLAILDYGDRAFYTSASDPRCLLTANLAVRREIFSTIGEFSPDFPRCQDHELQIRLWRAGARAFYAPDVVVRARVPPERLTRQYHRTWHSVHGVVTASMQLQEIIDGQGRLLDAPASVPRLFGTPGFVYRALLLHMRDWARAMVSGDRRARAAHGDRVWYYLAYIEQTARARHAVASSVGEAVGFVRAHVGKRLRTATMSARRVVAVQTLLAILVGWSAYDIFTGTEQWPFSPYPMFSHVERKPDLDGLRLVGVTDDLLSREVPLLDRALIAPFDQTRIATAFARLRNDPGRQALLETALRDCLVRYERGRTLGRHNGPALQGVRLYDEHWTLAPDAANVDAPDSRHLIAEVRGVPGLALSN